MTHQYIDVIVFVTLAVSMFSVDMLCHRRNTGITILNATVWTLAWFIVAGIFAGYLYVSHGSQLAF